MSVTGPPRRGPRAVIVLPADPDDMRIGGIASFVRSFVRFAPEDFDLSIVGVSAKRPVHCWSQINFEGRSVRLYPVLRADTTHRARIPLALRFTMSLLRRRPHGLDDGVMQFHRPGTDLWLGGAGLARVRFVHLATADLTQPGAESRWRRLRPLLERVEHRSLRRMDRVYVVNETAADAYRERWPDLAQLIRFLPNFYDDTIFAPLPEKLRAELRERTLSELGLPYSSRLVLFCGRLDGQKDPHLLVDAFAGLRARDADVVLLIAGDGDLASEVRRHVAERGLEAVVRLLGTQSRPRVNELMNVSELLVLTSRFETGPTVGYEALVTGAPVVTTAVGEVARIIRESGAGRVVDDRNPSSLADAMADVLSWPPGARRSRATSAGAPFAARAVLEPVYDWHRQVSLMRRATR